MAYQTRGEVITPGGRVEVPTEEAPVISAMLFAFAPLHKRAFGIATGVAGATLMAALTIAAILIPAVRRDIPLYLIGQYFEGYSVTWPGVLIGAAWGLGVAFVGGWFAAFCRNLALAISAFVIRTRAEIDSTREFLDHI